MDGPDGTVDVAGVRDATFAELDPPTLLHILRLRVDVFVVEQACAYPEIDGRDNEAGTRHVWLPAPDGRVAAYLRVLDDGDASRIGRVATATWARGQGLSGRLLDHVLAGSPTTFVLDAQSHLVDFYGRWGFVADGPAFVEDGIPHVPMRRRA